MALGIKKITESVIENGRSLIMIGTYNNTSNGYIENFKNNKAIPAGAILASPTGAVLRIKTGERESDQSRIDADGTLGLNSVTTRVLGDSSVTNQKLANDSVSESKIQNHAVSTAKIKALAVDTSRLADAAVTSQKLANSAVTNAKLENGAVNSIKLSNYAVTAGKIADGAVLPGNIAAGAVKLGNIDNNAVVTGNLKDFAVTTDKIADGTITKAKMNPAFLEELNKQTADKISVLQNEINTLKDTINTLQNEIKNAVKHDGQMNVNGANGSTKLINLECSGDIKGNRVYYMTYQDLAEAYFPGEQLSPGDIVSIHEDGKVYKATSMYDCIVGVVSDEYASCLGATKEELFNGSKVAVGMIGKVHVKVKGPVTLGQKINLSISEDGVGMASWNPNGCIGQALETCDCDFDEINYVLVQIRPM